MEMKNLCGKIPVALHLKVRAEIEQREISTQQFIQQVIEEHFMEKGVNRMEARSHQCHRKSNRGSGGGDETGRPTRCGIRRVRKNENRINTT